MLSRKLTFDRTESKPSVKNYNNQKQQGVSNTYFKVQKQQGMSNTYFKVHTSFPLKTLRYFIIYFFIDKLRMFKILLSFPSVFSNWINKQSFSILITMNIKYRDWKKSLLFIWRLNIYKSLYYIIFYISVNNLIYSSPYNFQGPGWLNLS